MRVCNNWVTCHRSPRPNNNSSPVKKKKEKKGTFNFPSSSSNYRLCPIQLFLLYFLFFFFHHRRHFKERIKRRRRKKKTSHKNALGPRIDTHNFSVAPPSPPPTIERASSRSRCGLLFRGCQIERNKSPGGFRRLALFFFFCNFSTEFEVPGHCRE